MFYALILCCACLLCFLAQQSIEGFTEHFLLERVHLYEKPWSILSYVFIHADFSHLLYNLLALGLFGSMLEKMIGKCKFMLIFLSSGLVSGMVGILLYEAVLGASGAIFGILGTLVVLKPSTLILAFGIPMPLILAVSLWALFDLLGMFNPSEVAHAAHLAGLTAGLCFGAKLRKFYRTPEQKIKIPEHEFRQWEERVLKPYQK